MKKVFYRGLLVFFLQACFLGSAFANAEKFEVLNLDNFNFQTATEAELKGKIFTQGGGRYVYVSPHSSVPVKVSAGMKLILWNSASGRYTYTGPITSDSIYAGDYLADGTFSEQAAKVTAVTGLRSVVEVIGQIQTRIAAVMDNEPVSAPQFALGTGSKNSFMSDASEEGVASGDESGMYGVWAQGSWSHIKDSNAATAFKANLYTGTFGGDIKVTDDILLGLAYTYGTIKNGKTEFNKGKFKDKSHTITPYFAYRFDDNFSIDAMAGYATVKKDFERTQFVQQGNQLFYDEGQVVKSDTKSKRWFGGLFGNAKYVPADCWTLSLRAGYIHFNEKVDGYRENLTEGAVQYRPGFKVKVGRFSGKFKVAYLVDKWLEPFAQAGYHYDMNSSKFEYKNGLQTFDKQHKKSGYMLGGGLRLYGHDGWSAILEGTHNFGQGDLKITTVSASVRYAF